MVSKILFWAGWGVTVRFFQLGLEMRPFFNKESLFAYPAYAGIGGSFGYWLAGVEERQYKILYDRRERLLEKRRRRAEREGRELTLGREAEGGVDGRQANST
ncbi:MAG: hypothetical protein M1817_005675 [Caeruleum heppii]|nr:MAG: hypothetical protein M1817_005675 [Caeruleum heppii]